MEISNEIIRSLGMALVHSLWQGAIILFIVLIVSGITGKSNARLRYVVMFSGLMLLLTAFAVTFIYLVRHIGPYSLTSAELKALMSQYPEAFRKVTVAGYNSPQIISRILDPLYPMLALTWLVGFAGMGIKMTGGFILSRQLIRRHLKLPDGSLQQVFTDSCAMINLQVFTCLRITTQQISPMVTGMIKPMVILPAAALTGLSASQIESVIIHELAHIKRYDHLLVVIQTFATQVLFFHPAAWFLSKEIDRERENCCDDFVIGNNYNPLNYIKALAMIQEMNLSVASGSNSLKGKQNELLYRIKRLTKHDLKISGNIVLTVCFLLFFSFGITALTFLLSQEPEKKIITEEKKTVTTDTTDKQEIKKDLRIVIVNDTIQEMTVNGEPVTAEERKAYVKEIHHLEEDLNYPGNEEIEIEVELKNIRESMKLEQDTLNNYDFYYLNRDLQGALAELSQNLSMKRFWENEQFQEQMKKAQEEARKAFEEMRKSQMEWKEQNWDKVRKEYEKASQEIFKALKEAHPVTVPPPPTPFFEMPEPPADISGNESTVPDQNKSLNSILKELEEEQE